jgi:hypothetical protein
VKKLKLLRRGSGEVTATLTAGRAVALFASAGRVKDTRSRVIRTAGVLVAAAGMVVSTVTAASAAPATLCCDLGQSNARPGLALFADGSGDVAAWKGGGGDNSIYVQVDPFSAGAAQTDQGPAVGNLRDRVYVAFKGVGADRQLYITSSGANDLINWTPPFAVPGAATDAMPTMATRDNVLYLAWKTPSQGLWWSWTTNGAPGTWAGGSNAILDGGSSLGPSLTATRAGLALGWKGLNADPRVFYARYEGGRWSPQQEGPASASTAKSPSLTAGTWLGDGLRFSWSGSLSSNYLVSTSYLAPNSGSWTAVHGINTPFAGLMRSKDGPSIIANDTHNSDHRLLVGAWEDFVADFAEYTNGIVSSD